MTLTMDDDTSRQSPQEPVDLIDAIIAVMRDFGDEVAVVGPTSRLSHRELDEWSDAIAAALRSAVGDGPDPVLVLTEHAPEAIAAFVGVAKCARPVVMLDRTTPVRRMQDIAEVAAPVGILFAPGFAETAKAIGPTAGRLLPLADRPSSTPPRFSPVPVPEGAPASIVFTSGSTGRPKGVIIGSRDFMSSLRDSGFVRAPDRRVLCPVPLGFVFGLGLLCQGLLSGGRLHLHDPRTLGVEGLADRIDAEGITDIGATPHVIRALAQSIPAGRVLPSVERVMLGGEAVLTRDVERVRGFTSETCVVLNQLGSSEAWGITRLAMTRDFELPATTALPVGAPVPGREVLLVDEDGGVVTEPGAIGAIHLVATHLSAGYWRDPVTTAERFRTLEDGRRLYVTGDLGRWNADGQLEYAGRADNMVKVRGYLVEPAEVESHIRSSNEVEDCVVVGRPSQRGDGSTVLIAYVVPAAATWVSGAALRRRLAGELPGWMVPVQVVELTELPRNANGKTDRLSLPEPPAAPAPAAVRKYEYEEAIAEVAATTLGLDGIGVDDDLFELGIDSLAVEEMVTVLDEQLGLQITSATIMQAPTAAQLARVPRRREQHLVDGIMTTIAPGDGRPIFAFSGAGGLALQLRELAHQLGVARPVYGIQSRGLEGGPLPDVSVGQMSRRYLRTMRRLQPHGPYSLIGHSLGAVVVLEVARRLLAAHETIDYIGLLDPPDTGSLEGSAAMAATMARRVDGGLPQPSAVGRLRGSLRSRYPFATRSFWRGARDDGRFRAWFEAGAAAAQRYRPRLPLAVDNAHVYLAEGASLTTASTWFDPSATIVGVSGDHLSMLRRPFVTELAATMSHDLARP